jgi:hypothetical protein
MLSAKHAAPYKPVLIDHAFFVAHARSFFGVSAGVDTAGSMCYFVE